MEGFLLYDFEDRFAEARRTLLGWYADGSLHVEHDILEGLENAPLGLRRLFDGGNLGKQILHVADPRMSADDDESAASGDVRRRFGGKRWRLLWPHRSGQRSSPQHRCSG